MSDSGVPAKIDEVKVVEERKSGLEALYRIQHPLKRAFLHAVIDSGGSLSKAAEIADIDRTTHYFWLHNDSDYEEAYKVAKGLAGDKLVDEVTERATRQEKPSDILLMFATKGLRPEYRDNAQINVNTQVNSLHLDKPQFDYEGYRKLISQGRG